MKFQNFLIVLSFSATFFSQAYAKTQAQLIIPISGDSGTRIDEANERLLKRGLPTLPDAVELNSDMTQDEVYKLKNSLDERMGQVSKYEAIETKAAYGRKVEGRSTCFKGDNKQVIHIYEAMIDTFLSEQFGILAVATDDPDHVGIKYDESDSGSEGTWINIRRCPTKK